MRVDIYELIPDSYHIAEHYQLATTWMLTYVIGWQKLIGHQMCGFT